MTDPKRVAFVYTRGRSARAESGKNIPDDFFYGFIQAKANGYSARIYEQEKPLKTIPILKRLNFWIQDRLFAHGLGIGFSTPYLFGHLPSLQTEDTCIGIADTIGLALAYFKSKGWLKTRILFVGMGLANRLWLMRNTPQYYIFRAICRKLLRSCDSIVLLGEGERRFYESEMPELKTRLELIPFGVDTSFWTPEPSLEQRKLNRPRVLFVGNDLNRDFKLVLEIARNLPEVTFEFVTNQIREDQISSNVTLLQGSLHSKALSDEELRDRYRKSTLTILPLKPSIQPSGQSVCLQAMACGSPVLISKTAGFWEPEFITENLHLAFVHSENVSEWVKKISNLIEDPRMRDTLSEQGRSIVLARYTSDIFSRRLLSLI